MSKRGRLFTPPKTDAPASQPAEPAAPAPLAARKSTVSKSRAGKRNVTAYLDPAAFRQLKRLAADEDAAVQDLLVEGINEVSAKRGLSRIA